GLDDIDVLKNRVRRAQIPIGFGDTLAGRQDVETLVSLRAEKVPAHLQMPDQAVGLVLGGDCDPADAGVHGIRQREIDNARLAAKINRRLGAAVGQFHQPAAASAGKDEGEGMTCERFVSVSPHVFPPAGFVEIGLSSTLSYPDLNVSREAGSQSKLDRNLPRVVYR